MSHAETPTSRNIIIIGGGIIGCTSAYYLSSHPRYDPSTSTITLLEASSIAGGASGKAGGLIARWAYPKELVDVSFEEHLKLSNEHGGGERWGWRVVECGEWVGRGEQAINTPSKTNESTKPSISLEKKVGLTSGKKSGLPSDLDWVHDHLTASYTPMSIAGSGDTMQVHPYLFTTSMAELAQQKGVKIIHGRVTGINYSSDGKSVEGVTYIRKDAVESIELKATDVLVAAGPWSSTAALLPSLPMSSVRAHSITIRPSRPVSAYALFTHITLQSGSGRRGLKEVSPEIYARPTNEVYVCSGGDSPPLPTTTADVLVDTQVCDELFEQVRVCS